MKRAIAACAIAGACGFAGAAERETARWQAAIDAASKAGGGVVTMPAGRHVTGSLYLKSNVTLDLAEGCVLEGSANPADYPDVHIEYAELREPWQGLVIADGQTNVAIVGRGEIFGNGKAFGHGVRLGRPQGLLFHKCRDVRVEGIRLRDLARWTCYLKECDGVTVRKIVVDSHANANNDGIDIDARNVLVEDCLFDSDDDGIVFKSDNADFIVENVTVRNCRVSSTCSAIKLGTGSHGGFRNILVENITAGASPREWCGPDGRGVISSYRVHTWPGSEWTPSLLSGIALECVDGGLLENVTIRNVTVARAASPIFIRGGLRYGRKFGGEVSLGLPFGHHCRVRNVLIENVTALATSWTASSITGVPGLRVTDITLRNVDIEVPGAGEKGRVELGKPVPEKSAGYPESNMFDGRMLPAYGFYIRHADRVTFENVNVRLAGEEVRPRLVKDDVTDFVERAVPTLAFTVEPGVFTVDEALARIRAARALDDKSTAVVTVKGVNELTRPIVLAAGDRDIRFVGEDGATFSGGQTLSAWREVAPGVVEADAPRGADGKPYYFDQLWIGSRRAPNARIPNEGWLVIAQASQTPGKAGADGAENFIERVSFSNDTVNALRDLKPADYPTVSVGIIHHWAYAQRALLAFDAAKNEITMASPFKWSPWGSWRAGRTLVEFRNVPSAFDAPGEWLLDLKAGKVRYRLMPGETAAKLTAVVPRRNLTNLVVFDGDFKCANPISNISFENIAFRHAASETLGNGPLPIRQCQAAVTMKGALSLRGVRNVVFDGCEIAGTAGYGFRFGSGCVSNRIVNCHLHDLGAGGVWMGADLSYEDQKGIHREINRPTRADSTAFNLISNNVIECGGRYNPEGTGVVLSHCSDTKILHNDIHDFYYSGVSVGWVWGYRGSVSQRNEVGWNRIWDLGKRIMSDMGGVYMLATSYGSHVHDNIVHDVYSYSYGGWALYTDEGSEGITMERNICWNTTDGGFHQHFGVGCVIRNNIFAFNDLLGAIRVSDWDEMNVPATLHFHNNIVYVEHGPLVGRNVRHVGGVWANNVWYDTRGRDAALFDETNWVSWVESGKEVNSVFADPRFRDVKKFDFTLLPDSPALKLGFKPFDLSAAGAKVE